jgi:antitoxin component of RelBE/YafQ-DinJ toxin-antitoxin module
MFKFNHFLTFALLFINGLGCGDNIPQPAQTTAKSADKPRETVSVAPTGLTLEIPDGDQKTVNAALAAATEQIQAKYQIYFDKVLKEIGFTSRTQAVRLSTKEAFNVTELPFDATEEALSLASYKNSLPLSLSVSDNGIFSARLVKSSLNKQQFEGQEKIGDKNLIFSTKKSGTSSGLVWRLTIPHRELTENLMKKFWVLERSGAELDEIHRNFMRNISCKVTDVLDAFLAKYFSELGKASDVKCTQENQILKGNGLVPDMITKTTINLSFTLANRSFLVKRSSSLLGQLFLDILIPLKLDRVWPKLSRLTPG